MIIDYTVQGEVKNRPRIVGLLICTGDEVVSDDYNAYEIVIQTTAGDIKIEGAHDWGPDVVLNENILGGFYRE
jgi:hypothetical protein